MGSMSDAVLALGRDRTIAQFHHTAWTAKDGAPSQITALAQTTDGFLWIGTARGLFRFDGVQFERYKPPAGVTLPSENIYTILATPDGGLWISFRSRGLGFLKNGQLTVFTRPDETPQSWVYSFASDHDSRLWAGTYEGLALRQGTRWLEIGPEWNLERGRVWSMIADREGTLWVGIGTRLRFLRRGSTRFEDAGVSTSVKRLAQSAEGAIWIAERDRYLVPLRGPKEAGLSWSPEDILFDRDNTLWITASPNGLKRMRYPERAAKALIEGDDPILDDYRERDGLSGDVITLLFEDREGTIWVGTNKGLDRFRYSHIAGVQLPPQFDQLTLLADKGDVWVGSATNINLAHVRDNDVTARPSPLTSCVYREPGGDVWWGGHAAIWRQHGDRIKIYPQPQTLRTEEQGYGDWMWEVVGGDDRDLWVRVGNLGLVHFKDGVWSRRPPPPGLLPQGPSATYRDADGRIWFGYSTGRADLLDHGRVMSFTRGNGLDIGRIKVIRGRGSEVWFGGETGLALFHDGKFRNVLTNTGERFGTISGIVATADGALWLNELRGVVRILPGEVRKILANHPASYQLLDYRDGMPGAPQMNFTVSTAVETTDGRLWFATDNGLARIDPAHLQTNNIPPPVMIRSIVADREYSPGANLRFAVGTEKLQVRYTALSLAIPERVTFRYKLEGLDDQWQDAGARREAFYTNLRPGHYTFRVKAANNDGVWNEAGVALAFEIPPAFFQTKWFLALCIALGAALLWATYLFRLRQVEGRMQRLHDERMDERIRIARELHDTLLQGFLSASMRLHLASDQLSDDSPAKPIITDVIDLVSEVNEQGRQAVQGLRLPEQRESLEEAFGRTKHELGEQRQIGFRVLVEGKPRALHPLIRDEIYRIGREALVNAFRHSAARNIEVELEYLDKRLRLHVRDDGRGIDPGEIETRRDEHWGLAGMQERAQKIGARLSVSSRAGVGSEIELTVPARVAYRLRK